MKNRKLFLLSLIVLLASTAFGQNPIIRDQFTADPTARVFNGKVYLYPSHDIVAPPDKNLRKDWFCMEDYHVFSSENLTDWTDHGMIVTQSKVPWLTKLNYDMWAPDCVFKNGKYYFYFPVAGKIGVATADKPEGPYTVLDQPVKGVGGIDPCVLFAKDGKAYMFTSAGRIRVAQLKDNMIDIEGQPQVIDNLPTKGLIEGPFAFERNGKYYLRWSEGGWTNDSYKAAYGISDSPFGPFKKLDIILQSDSTVATGAGHHSVVNVPGSDEWYIFYHRRPIPNEGRDHRVVCVDRMYFNPDGTIAPVKMTKEGVAQRKIKK